MPKIKVIHFYNGTGGGVLSVIRNLLKYSENPSIENHIVYTINKYIDSRTTFPKIDGAVSEKVFFYSAKWNFYYTCKQLAKLLPDDKAVVIAHDWLELGMMSNLGLQNPVVQFLHGDYDYYYQLAKHHQMAIDSFICVAENIENRLKAQLPSRTEDIVYLRFPVCTINAEIKERENNLIFIGRLDEAKGYPLLAEIAQKLIDKKITWHIVGASDDISGTNIWDENIPVMFYGNIPNEEVLRLLPGMKITILPSKAEGMPVVIIEAMKAGVIPVVNNLPGGIQELVKDNETGYKINENNISSYAEKIRKLIEDKDLSMYMQKECMKLANMLFEPVSNTNVIEKQVENIYRRARKRKSAIKVYGSRLDVSLIPNWIVARIRN